MRLVRIALAGTMATSGMLALGVTPAHAATHCSGWKTVENFQERACVITESARTIRHRHYVRHLIDRIAVTQVTTFRYLNGRVSICSNPGRVAFLGRRTNVYSCSSTRVKMKYMTRGYITKQAGGNVGVDSPTING